MSIHVALSHRSHYQYDRAVGHSAHVIRLRPAPHCRTPILSYSLKIQPSIHFINWQQDPFGNYLGRLVFPEKSSELLVEVDLHAEMSVLNPFDFFLEPGFEQWPFEYESSLKKQLAPFLELEKHGPLFDQFVAAIPRNPTSTIDFVVALNQRLAKDVTYLIRLAPGVQTPEETCELKSGSCRDTAWMLVQVFRSIGLAARFASGYLIQLAPDVKALDGPSGTERDFTDLHAWCEVYLPGAGWIGLDPTSGLLAGEGHIPLACTPFPSDAAPITGATDDCECEFKHEMQVQRMVETPRVTKPYSEEQWAEIVGLGYRIDEDLRRGDVRLTMGGEPTFISVDNMDGEEWKFTAVSEEKRKLSAVLLRRLQKEWAPGALLHFGQGKWYPGESLPRWALGCYWRSDGVPIWENPALLADESHDYGYGAPEAKRFIAKLAHVLEVKQKHIMPGYEDAWYYMWRERRLPGNVDPLSSKLDDKEERERIAKIFRQGLGSVVGYVLPIQPSAGAPRGWASGPWFLRGEHLFLLPGDSPMGLRLPLDSLPWVKASDYPFMHPRDPFDRAVPLVYPRSATVHQPAQSAKLFPTANEAPSALSEKMPGHNESASWIVRTALCVEPRKGKLCIFMPPTRDAVDYLLLLAAIEETSAALQMPVVIEGSTPPPSPWLKHFKITPDPGVIEVNLQPAKTWEELVSHTTTLYEEARGARLGAEKFMIDGRHVGTGGGNHVILGGETPEDSPLLRRPDLLRSLLCFWQNHPSLSFLFSGLFIGPTSQHPRVDEARNDSLYELDLAFKQVPDRREGGHLPPWLVDRLFRNLLIDSSGNTHRAEFSIDKLYSPDSSSGRLGLLELRAFEMPPHARMSLTQQLLLRALIARFWKSPYQQKLVRWGTELHDRFMLPHFVADDFHEVIADLQSHGYELKEDWFAPHLEFRFPRYGSVTQRGIDLEIRQALEPWHVLGEEGNTGGTVRYVDASLDRLQ
ncbi:MAG: transglutaminase family protein, partial [Limisphaerales bacterium]